MSIFLIVCIGIDFCLAFMAGYFFKAAQFTKNCRKILKKNGEYLNSYKNEIDTLEKFLKNIPDDREEMTSEERAFLVEMKSKISEIDAIIKGRHEITREVIDFLL